MNVLVLPEDFRKDQYILAPVLRALLAAVGRPHAKVKVCTDPLFGSVQQALDWHRLAPVLDRYRGMVDLFLLVVDRDGDPRRRARLDAIEQRARELLGAGRCLLAEHAIEEVEVWALAGAPLPKAWAWRTVRAHPHPKETYFEPYTRTRGLEDEPGEGRVTLGTEAAAAYTRVRQLCPDDLGVLESRVRTFVTTGECPGAGRGEAPIARARGRRT